MICLKYIHLAPKGKSCQTLASSGLYLDISLLDLFGKRLTLASKCSVLLHSPLPNGSGKCCVGKLYHLSTRFSCLNYEVPEKVIPNFFSGLSWHGLVSLSCFSFLKYKHHSADLECSSCPSPPHSTKSRCMNTEHTEGSPNLALVTSSVMPPHLPHTFAITLECPSQFFPPGVSNLAHVSSHSSDIPSLLWTSHPFSRNSARES